MQHAMCRPLAMHSVRGGSGVSEQHGPWRSRHQQKQLLTAEELGYFKGSWPAAISLPHAGAALAAAYCSHAGLLAGKDRPEQEAVKRRAAGRGA